MSDNNSFADLLRQLMLEKRITASDLARAIWGTTKDYRGYDVARGRDRIGHYLAGNSFPEKENLTKIAKALGTNYERLAKTQPAPTVRQARDPKDPLLTIYSTGPNAGKAHLVVKVDLSLKAAMAIIEMIKADRAKDQPAKKTKKALAPA
jgi:transcriptional regulator with XRE-family HTH domain